MCVTEKSKNTTVNSSVIVRAKTPEDALLNIMKYHAGALERIEVIHDGKNIQVIS
jgi:hypothetical protein